MATSWCEIDAAAREHATRRMLASPSTPSAPSALLHGCVALYCAPCATSQRASTIDAKTFAGISPARWSYQGQPELRFAFGAEFHHAAPPIVHRLMRTATEVALVASACGFPENVTGESGGYTSIDMKVAEASMTLCSP